MPESTGSMYCPVDSFIKYTDKLHPDCDRLWQRPRDCFVDDDNEIWYYNAPVGEKKLKTLMSDLSLSCKLSQKYTNHSIRATGASILSKHKFNDAQIMSVTGHKSVQSLSVYQRVDTQEKLEMGQTLGVTMGAVPARIEALPAPLIRSALPAPPARLALTENGSMVPALIEADTPQTLHFEGFDLNAILGDFDYNESSLNVSNTRQAAGPQLFHKCKVTIIQNLTLNK
ncbi:uncharacterized protein [Mytilus edulis]|uniref:Tyr recombinase domain-containing protein n=1 Tax=Mytilus galloprovincialis TaxID=29158 RepID=A0A8B6CU17_MYTGA|nr:Hypothetical predicted protein [Mytilus galloprovincialis]